MMRMHKIQNRLTTTLLILWSVAILSGCGSAPHENRKTGQVTVKVTLNGKPVPDVSVSFESPDKMGGGGSLDAEGVITINEIEIGEYTVTINPPDPDPVPPELGETKPAPEVIINIPQQYRSAAESPLKATVKQGSNQFEFELKE